MWSRPGGRDLHRLAAVRARRADEASSSALRAVVDMGRLGPGAELDRGSYWIVIAARGCQRRRARAQRREPAYVSHVPAGVAVAGRATTSLIVPSEHYRPLSGGSLLFSAYSHRENEHANGRRTEGSV
jgi:hypothetical protein